MSITIPPFSLYGGQYFALQSNFGRVPPEGPKFVPLEINWGAVPNGNKCVKVDLALNSVLPLSQITAMWIDNSGSGADVQIIFPTVSSTVLVPASQGAMVPVPSNSTLFYVSAPACLAVDVTRIDVYNFVPPPVAMPKTSFQQAAASGANNLTIGTANLLSSAVSGTLTGIDITFGYNSSAAFNIGCSLTDGSSTVATGYMQGAAGSSGAFKIIHFDQINVRFNGGLNLVTAGTAPNNSPGFSYTLLYRTP